MTKIVFINPAGFGTISERGPHIGIGYLASACRENGCSVRVIGINNMDTPDEDAIIRDLAEWGADIVGLTVTSFSVRCFVRLAEKIRSEIPNAKIIAGGTHPTICCERFLTDNQNLLDMIVLGEGDRTILEVIDFFNGTKKLSDIPGAAHIDNGQVLKNSCRQRIRHLDPIAFPAYDLFEPALPLSDYYPMITSRGCPYACIFCVSKTFWQQRYHDRSPEKILEEIYWAKAKYNFKELRLFDDNFTQDRERAIEICKGIVESKMDIRLTLVNGVRADSIDQELADWLKRAGLKYLMIGVEDGSEEVFQRIKKGETLGDISRAVEIFKAIGIELEATMVIGLPGATYQTTESSLQFLRKHSIKGHWIVAVPFKGTELYDYAKDNGRIFIDVENGFDVSMVNYPPLIAFDTPEFDRQERLKAFEMVNIASENYHFLVKPGETLLDGAKRILRLIEHIDPNNVEYHCTRINETFGLELSYETS